MRFTSENDGYMDSYSEPRALLRNLLYAEFPHLDVNVGYPLGNTITSLAEHVLKKRCVCYRPCEITQECAEKAIALYVVLLKKIALLFPDHEHHIQCDLVKFIMDNLKSYTMENIDKAVSYVCEQYEVARKKDELPILKFEHVHTTVNSFRMWTPQDKARQNESEAQYWKDMDALIDAMPEEEQKHYRLPVVSKKQQAKILKATAESIKRGGKALEQERIARALHRFW